MNKNNSYEGFSLILALVDVIPVILFALAAGIINSLLNSYVISAGIFLCLIGGLGKVTWKILLAVIKKDFPFLFYQMRVTMPLGFITIFIGVLLKKKVIVLSSVFKAVTSFPAILFFIVGILGIIAMIILAKKMDQKDSKSNWIEQCTNIVAQGGFLLGIIFSVFQ